MIISEENEGVMVGKCCVPWFSWRILEHLPIIFFVEMKGVDFSVYFII